MTRISIKHIMAAAIVAACALAAAGQEPAVAPVIVDIESVAGCQVIVPQELMERLIPSSTVDIEEEHPDKIQSTTVVGGKKTTAGYRVQVFSDNNAKTAQSQARSKESQVAAAFPQWRTYKRYTAPYWRLRVGDFRTRAEADDAVAKLRAAFPSFANEIRVVNDRINIGE